MERHQPLPWRLPLLLLLVAAMAVIIREVECQQGQWCIARSGATEQALQSALEYACGRGIADCAPIQSSGLCYLPNTAGPRVLRLQLLLPAVPRRPQPATSPAPPPSPLLIPVMDLVAFLHQQVLQGALRLQ
ncbi:PLASMODESMATA CALLOSE-BINDING PROTEIN 2-like [Iris pallida]|uniref:PLASMODESMATA CALLOSE-BINDING PROTEIN 2-like n=1 Tax=Iris pallida TaxID=29817 RepID=A0AAX6DHE1_IRIPA|nr:PLASMODESMATA CALLOSE-BINDING PROTEIN 2-like [Iris pallida]